MSEKKVKDRPMSNTHFKSMIKHFEKRDKNYPAHLKIEKTKIKKGDIVLDYGCGPGSYTIAAAEAVGKTGKIYAADIHPLAIEEVKSRAKKRGLINIETIQTDCDTKLEDKIVNVALLLDILYHLSDPESILRELYRVLKNNGWLSVDDHHLNDDELIRNITHYGFFKFVEKKDEVFTFMKI